MDVKEAVAAAKNYLSDLFSNEGLENIRLEEVEYDDANASWNITLGFLRRRQAPLDGLMASVLSGIDRQYEPREYKIVRISDSSSTVKSVKNREPNQ
jgi:hypothetical protein